MVMTQWYKDHLPGEGPQHRVRITKPFYLGMYMVTQEEYQRVMGTNPSEFSATGKQQRQGSRSGHEAVSGGEGIVGRCGGVLPKTIGDAGGEGGGANVSTAFGGAVGVCLPRGEHRSVQFQFGPQAGFPRRTRSTSCPTTGGSAAIPAACRTRWAESGQRMGIV